MSVFDDISGLPWEEMTDAQQIELARCIAYAIALAAHEAGYAPSPADVERRAAAESIRRQLFTPAEHKTAPARPELTAAEIAERKSNDELRLAQEAEEAAFRKHPQVVMSSRYRH